MTFTIRPAAGGHQPLREWRTAFEIWHTGLIGLILVGLAIWALVEPNSGLSLSGGTLLLGAGALIGLPHGASDFFVAYRWLAPHYGTATWLPLFVTAYLALVSIVLGGWVYAPLLTLGVFLIISGLHFGTSDIRDRDRLFHLRFALRAATPLLPIFMFHPAEIGVYVSALGGITEASVVEMMVVLRSAFAGPWIALGAFVLLSDTSSVLREGVWSSRQMLDDFEIVGLSVAALLLPPLVTFAVYFCLLHSVRHMVQLSAEAHPRRAAKALSLVAMIILPSSLVCLVALALCWDAVSGMMSTGAVITNALRIVAALTVPHMALEFLSVSPRLFWGSACLKHP